MVAEAGGMPDLLACLMAEAGRKRPAEPMVEAYCFMLEALLTSLRIAGQGGNATARADLAQAGETLELALTSRKLPPFIVMQVARAVTQAGLEAGPALEQAMSLALEDQMPAAPALPRRDEMAAHLASVAEALGHDPFVIHSEFIGMGAAFSAGHRAAMAAELASSTIPALREAALGFLLEARPGPGTAVLEALEAQAASNPAPSRLVERLVSLRPWLPPARQERLDRAIRALRPHAAAPVPEPRSQPDGLLATLCDGAGAQSLFALLKRGGRFALASMLLKEEEGVAEAWVRGDLSKREAEGILAQIAEDAEAVPVTAGFVTLRLADALTIHVARQAPPPFGLLQVTEGLGVGLLQPAAMPPQALVARLLVDQPPERTGPEATRAAHARAADWPERFRVVESWFEVGEAVEALLRPIRLHQARVEAVLTRILPARRAVWAARCAWMAATLQGSVTEEGEDWLDFALVARDLAGERPLAGLPLLEGIAEATVQAFAAGERRRPAAARRGR